MEIDATLAATLGLQDGQRVMATIHVDPPLVHTINIEPLTPEDWEIIELHATFLEINMLSQIRALPNPAFSPSPGAAKAKPHPLTLHLSPTSTANVKVISLEPALPPESPFAKIAPDAEVIVAPKTRTRSSRSGGGSKSVASTSRKSLKSSTSTARNRAASREERKPALFLRGVSREVCREWFGDDDDDDNEVDGELSVWIDRDIRISNDFKSLDWVTVNVLRPAGLEEPTDPQKDQFGVEADSPKPAGRVVARLQSWDDAPNGQTVAISAPLCAA